MLSRSALFVLISALITTSVWGVPAAPNSVTLIQDDGSTFEARQRGDEYSNWIETTDGYSIVESNGAWHYASQDNSGNLVATEHKVGKVAPTLLSTFSKHLSPYVDPANREEHTIRKLGKPTKRLLEFGTAPHTQNVVVILASFSDTALTYTASDFNSSMFGASASVKHFFLENSYNSFTLQAATETNGTTNDGVIAVALAYPHPNFGSVSNQTERDARNLIVTDSLTAADAAINFSSYDSNADGNLTADELSIVIITAGYEASLSGSLSPNVWGHKSGLSTPSTKDGVTISPFTMFGEKHGASVPTERQGTIGIMCHELGHLMLGLPDLYDTDQSSEGIGRWGLMGSASWNTVSVLGDTPGHLTAWSKVVTEMVTPTDISTTSNGVSIQAASGNASIKRLWIDRYKVRESFLLENRQQSGYDTGLPFNGLLIWHIDDSQIGNTDETHKWVDLEAADNAGHMDANINRGDTGDPFPGTSSNTTFNDVSSPNSKDYASGSTSIGVSSISASMATMTANLVPSSTGAKGDHVRTDDGYTSNRVGYSQTTIWTALAITNATSHDLFEGFEVYTWGSTTVDFYLYDTITSNILGSQLYAETGFAASLGWNRFMLTTPQTLNPASSVVMVLKIVSVGQNFPAFYDGNGAIDERSYINGSLGATPGTFFPLSAGSGFGDLNQIALFGSAVSNTAPTITGQNAVSLSEDTSRAITLADISITDPDPDMQTLTVQDGTNYTHVGNTITPTLDYHGTLTVPLIVNDGTDNSPIFNMSVTVNSATDAAVSVNFGFGGSPKIGTVSNPYSSLSDGLAGVSSGGTLTIATGSSTWTGTINQVVTMQSTGGAATIGSAPIM